MTPLTALTDDARKRRDIIVEHVQDFLTDEESWTAYFEGGPNHRGAGPTKDEAVRDLLENVDE